MRKLLTLFCIFTIGVSVYLRKGNIYDENLNYEKMFTEPFEIVYFIFENGDYYGLTSNHAYRIEVYEAVMYQVVIVKEKRDIKNLKTIIHNHLIPAKFSDADMRTYRYFRKRGFKGDFSIYYPFSGKIITKR